MRISKDQFIHDNAPCYLYDKEQIVSRCKALQAAMPNAQFLYSLKANPFKPVVSAMANIGFGADAASSQEVLLAHECGIPVEEILYSSPGKTEQDITTTLGKCTLIADSLNELKLINNIAVHASIQTKVGIRIQPTFGMQTTCSLPSKFGIEEGQLDGVFKEVSSLENVIICGLHVHLQSQVLNEALLSNYYRNCYDLAQRIAETYQTKIEFINFGSGIGTVYNRETEHPVNLETLGQTLKELSEFNAQGLRAKFYIETGRYVTCNAGTYYTRIADIKESGGTTYVIVENGLNGFLRPSIASLLQQVAPSELPLPGLEPLYTTENEFEIGILGSPSPETKTVSVVGNLCTSLDVIAKDVELPIANIGDIVEITNAGSYGYTLSPLLFSSHQAPKQFLWEGMVEHS